MAQAAKSKRSKVGGKDVSPLKLPEGAVPVPGNVVAEGETTGHAHRVKGRDAVVYDYDGKRVQFAPYGAEATHEEHGVVAFPPIAGNLIVSGVMEYDHLKEEAVAVRD